jgi:4-azaleucine resistance transporter AzlC
MIFALTDETYALLCAAGEVGSTEDRDNLAWWMALLNQSYWVIGSTLGALLGSYITFNITGIEFAMTALFTVIVVEQWLNSKNHLPSIVGFVCATIALIWLGPAQFLLPALIVTVLMLLIMRNVVEPSR